MLDTTTKGMRHMRFLVLTKRSLLIILLCAVCGVSSAVVGVSTASQAVASADRVIPVYCVDRGEEKVCSISFDAAWGNEQTDTLLDILGENDVKTTFFLVGDWVKKYPDSVKKIAAEGHDVGNHSSTHPHMTQLSAAEMNAELTDCNSEVKKLTGKSPTLFRPPYGDYNNDVVNGVKALGMYCVQWNIDSLDWKDPTPEQIVKNCTEKLVPGSIILLHNGAKNTPAALPDVIKAIKAKGYKIVPISELIPKGKYYTDVQGMMHISQ